MRRHIAKGIRTAAPDGTQRRDTLGHVEVAGDTVGGGDQIRQSFCSILKGS
jgi:hypothetical protein